MQLEQLLEWQLGQQKLLALLEQRKPLGLLGQQILQEH